MSIVICVIDRFYRGSANAHDTPNQKKTTRYFFYFFSLLTFLTIFELVAPYVAELACMPMRKINFDFFIAAGLIELRNFQENLCVQKSYD